MTARGRRPLFTPAERRALGRCQQCEHHPPTQGHALDCPTRVTWRGSGGPEPLEHSWDIPAAPTTDTAVAAGADDYGAPELTLDLDTTP